VAQKRCQLDDHDHGTSKAVKVTMPLQ